MEAAQNSYRVCQVCCPAVLFPWIDDLVYGLFSYRDPGHASPISLTTLTERPWNPRQAKITRD